MLRVGLPEQSAPDVTDEEVAGDTKRVEEWIQLGYGELETANLLAKASSQSFDSIVAKFKGGEGWGKIAHDMGLNLGKIVSDAHRSNPEQTKGKDEQSLIPGPGIRKNSILYTGITPIPSATVSRGVNPVPSATMSPRP